MSLAADHVVDALRHPDSYPPDQARVAERIIRDRLGEPLTTDEAAAILRVSRPTVHAWLGAGLLKAADRPGRAVRLDTGVVYQVASILDRNQRHNATLEDRVEEIRTVLDEMQLAAQPDLGTALGEAEKGEFVPFGSRRRTSRSASKPR